MDVRTMMNEGRDRLVNFAVRHNLTLLQAREIMLDAPSVIDFISWDHAEDYLATCKTELETLEGVYLRLEAAFDELTAEVDTAADFAE